MRSLIGTIVERDQRVTNLATATRNVPVPYVSAGSHVWGSSLDGTEKVNQSRQYGANGTLFGVVSRLATATAQVEWKLWRKAKSGKKEDRTEVTSHAAIDLWNNPNPFFTQRDYVESVEQHVDLTGEGWMIVGYNPRAKIPLELWFARPDRMRPVVSPTRFCIGYKYVAPDGEEVPLDLDQVVRLRMPDPDNPYRGMGPVQSLLRTLDRARYSEEWNRNFFANSAEPGGIIEVEERLGDDEFNEFRTRWAEAHQGVNNAHRVAILENGMKWVERKYSARDMQFAELEQIGPDRIREAYGFPKFAQGIVDDVNRATAEASDAMFANWLTVPRLDRFKDALNMRILPLFGGTTRDLEWDYANPVPPNAEQDNAERTSKADAAQKYIAAGFTGESVVEALGLPEALVWEKPEPPAPPAFPGGQKPPAPQDNSVPALLARLVNAVEDADGDMRQVQKDWETALLALLAVWAGVTAAQRAEIASQVAAAVGAGNVAGLAALSVSSEQGGAVLAAALTAMAATAAAQAASEAAAQGVEVAVPGIAGGDLALVAAAVAGLLAAGLATAAGKEALRLFFPGADGAEVAAQVDQHLAGLSDRYLRDQLGGALTRAQNVGRLETFRAAEAVNPQVEYIADEILDSNTCSACRKIDGRVFDAWIDAWEAYAGGSYRQCLGGVRCRGTVRARWIGGA